MAITFCDPGGDATFGLELWTAIGAPTVVSDIVHIDHVRSIRGVPGGVNYLRTPTGLAGDAGGRWSVFLYIVTLPNATSTIFGLMDASNAIVARVRVTSTGVVQVWHNTAGIGSNGSTLSAGHWYQITFDWTITSTTVNRFEVFNGSVSDISITNATLGGTGATKFCLGNVTGNTVFDARFNDVYLDNSAELTYPGDVHITAKRPNANGTTNGFIVQIGSGGSSYGSGHSPQINERALSTTNGWSTALLSTTEEYSIEALNVGDVNLTGASIIDFMGWLYANASTSVTAQMILAGSNSYISLTTTNTMFTKAAGSTTYPAGNTDIGMISSGSAATESLYECGILIAYIPGTTRTVSEAAFMRDATSSFSLLARQNVNAPVTSDSTIRSTLLNRRITESAMQADTQTVQSLIQRRATEVMVFLDQWQRVAQLFRSQGDAIELADSVFRPSALVYLASLLDSMLSVDTLPTHLFIFRVRTEAVVTQDSLSAQTAMRRLLADTAEVSDAVQRAVNVKRQSSDSMAMADALSALRYLSRLQTETIEVTDAWLVQTVARYLRSLLETLPLSDQTTVQAQVLRQQVETLLLADTTGASRNILRAIQETLDALDVLKSSVSLQRQALETVQIADMTQAMSNLLRTMTDAPALADAIAIDLRIARQSTEMIEVSDAITYASVLARRITESLDVADVWLFSTVASYIRVILETLPVSESVSQTVFALRQQIDTLIANESVSSFSVLSRTTTEMFPVADLVQAARIIARLAADAIVVNDRLTSMSQIQRALIESPELAETLSRVLQVSRTQSESLSVLDVVLTSVLGTVLRTVLESLDMADQTSATIKALRVSLDSLQASDTIQAASTLLRSVQETTVIADALARELRLSRQSADFVQLNDALIRTAQAARQVSESLEMSDAWSFVAAVTSLFTVLDSMPMTDRLAPTYQAIRRQLDAFLAVDTPLNRLDAIRSLLEATDIHDSTTSALTISRSLLDAASMAEAITRVSALIRTMPEAILTADVAANYATVLRTILDEMLSADRWSGVLSMPVYQRTLTELMGVIDQLDRVVLSGRSSANVAGLSDQWFVTITSPTSVHPLIQIDIILGLVDRFSPVSGVSDLFDPHLAIVSEVTLGIQ